MTNERINPEVLMTNYVASALRILQAGALNHSIGSRDPHRELSASSFGFVSDFVIRILSFRPRSNENNNQSN